MIKDINIIKKELSNFREINNVYQLIPNDRIKYITLQGKNESFYLGGKYIRMGDNKIVLYNGGNTWSVPIQIKDNNCNVLYNTRFFVELRKDKNIDEISELKQIIKKQRNLLNKFIK